MHLKEEALRGDQVVQQVDMNYIARTVYTKTVSLYVKANAGFSVPVIMDEATGMQKFLRLWGDVEIIVRKQKGFINVKQKMCVIQSICRQNMSILSPH